MSYITGLAGTPGAGYFTDNLGHPKLWVATETWGLPINAGEWNGSGGGTVDQDYDNFFSQRAAQGFTVCMTDPVWTAHGAELRARGEHLGRRDTPRRGEYRPVVRGAEQHVLDSH